MPDGLIVNENGFILARDARAAGLASSLHRALAAGEIDRVRKGVYVLRRQPDPKMSKAEQRAMAYRRQVLAAGQTLTAPVFASYSAVALHRLPIYGEWSPNIHVLSPDGHGHRRTGLISVARCHDPAIETIEGCAVTAVEASVIQFARDAPLAAALTAVDAAIRTTRLRTHPPKTTIERLWAEHERMGRYTGVRKVRAVLERSSTLADTPLETCSRLVIEEWGFPEPELQHELWLPERGKRAFLDFYWEEYGIGAEADGRGKYLGQADAAASAHTVVEEKDRENAIRRQLRGFDRWDWTEMRQRFPVRNRLRAVGLPVVRRPIRLL